MKLHPTQGLNGRVVFQRVTFFLCLLILRAGPGVAVPDLTFTSPVLQPPVPGASLGQLRAAVSWPGQSRGGRQNLSLRWRPWVAGLARKLRER